MLREEDQEDTSQAVPRVRRRREGSDGDRCWKGTAVVQRDRSPRHDVLRSPNDHVCSVCCRDCFLVCIFLS